MSERLNLKKEKKIKRSRLKEISVIINNKGCLILLHTSQIGSYDKANDEASTAKRRKK
jgi:hypothetical protein